MGGTVVLRDIAKTKYFCRGTESTLGNALKSCGEGVAKIDLAGCKFDPYVYDRMIVPMFSKVRFIDSECQMNNSILRANMAYYQRGTTPNIVSIPMLDSIEAIKKFVSEYDVSQVYSVPATLISLNATSYYAVVSIIIQLLDPGVALDCLSIAGTVFNIFRDCVRDTGYCNHYNAYNILWEGNIVRVSANEETPDLFTGYTFYIPGSGNVSEETLNGSTFTAIPSILGEVPYTEDEVLTEVLGPLCKKFEYFREKYAKDLKVLKERAEAEKAVKDAVENSESKEHNLSYKDAPYNQLRVYLGGNIGERFKWPNDD